MKTRLTLFLLLCIVLIISSCREDVDVSALKAYEGPMNMSINFHLIQSDSAIVRSDIKAPKQLEFANGNMEFPEGIEIQIFDQDAQLTTTLKADRGYLFKQENIFKGEGNVQVHNLIKDQKLQSEELYWEPNKKKIYSEKFVRIQNGGNFSYGSSFESDETFSTYKMTNIRDSQVELKEGGN